MTAALIALALFTAAAAAGVVPGSSMLVSTAYAGQWMQVSCANPDFTPAPSDGWSSLITGLPGGSSNNSTNCTPVTAMYADLEPTGTGQAAAGARETLEYTPPAGSILTGGSIGVNVETTGLGGDPTGAVTINTPANTDDASDTILRCDTITGMCNGTAANNFSGVLQLPADRGGNLYLNASCEGTQGQSCNLTANFASSSVQLLWAHLLLTNNSSPTASGFSGSLLSPNAHGTTDIVFSASDPDGPGVYQVTIEIDGNTVYNDTPNTNGGECIPIDAFPTETTLMFDRQQPCPQAESVDIPVTTTTLSDGEHNLKIIVTDAAENASTVLDQTITTLNHQATNAPSSSPALTPRTAAAATPSAASAAPPVYTLSLGAATRPLTSGITRPYSDSAVHLAGVVKTKAGAAASGMPVTLWAKAANSGTYKQLARTTTNSSGTWALNAPPGPSRLLRVTTGPTQPPTRANNAVSVRETVTPTLSLNVATPGHATLIFTGQLSIAPLGTPRPLVIIETPGRNGWEAVGTPIRVDAHGRFRYTYRSSPLTLNRTFQFLAVTPATALWQRGHSPAQTAVIR